MGYALLAMSASIVAGKDRIHADDRLFGLPEGHSIREGARVLLKVPYELVLPHEKVHLYVGIKNTEDESIEICETSNVYQFHFQARAEAGEEELRKFPVMPWGHIQKMKLTGFSWMLQKGQRLLFRSHMYDFRTGGNLFPPGTREIRVCILVGEKEWIVSDWVPARMLDDMPLNEQPVVMEIHRPEANITLPVHQVEIDGRAYVFVSHHRAARVPQGADVRFEMDANPITFRRLLSVHFDGTDVPKLVWDVTPWVTREWTPETAPHNVVFEAMKEELQGEDAEQQSPDIP